MKITDLKNKKIAILGFGKEGISTLNFLVGINANNITVLDEKTIYLDKNMYSNVLKISGDSYLDHLDSFDVIIKSPGISPYNPKILPYRSKLTSQTDIFFSNYTGKVIGVTATKGKSTTVSILYKTLEHVNYRVKLVGNIGKPVFDEVNLTKGEQYDYIIYELSSFMLEGFSPKLHIGVLGNIFRCHVDWHNNNYKTYQNAKCNILKNAEYKIAGSAAKVLLNANGVHGDNIHFFGLEGKSHFDDGIFYSNDLKVGEDVNISLLGEHNRVNITGVIAVLDTISQTNSSVSDTQLYQSLFTILLDFETLPHRLNNIGTYNGLIFIDDSLASTPDSTAAAISTFSGNTGCIFLGGHDYGFDF